MMCKLKGGWIRKGIMMWKSKGGCKRGHYDCKLKGRMDKEGIMM